MAETTDETDAGRAAAGPEANGGSLERDAGELREKLGELVRVYQFRYRNRICCHGVSVAQSHALDVIARTGPTNLNDLAAALYLNKSMASRIVQTLKSKGYVERSPDPEDGRRIRIELTGPGRRLRDRIEAELVEEERRLLAEFDPEVRRSLTRLVDRLARRAAAGVEASDGTCRWPG